MERVFGLPADALSVWLAIALAASLGAVAVLALRNLTFLKIGVRNIPRRRGRSTLIVLGLMLGTAIISSSLLTGDTMARSVRSEVVHSLGLIDQTVTGGTTADVADVTGVATAKPYFVADYAVSAVTTAARSLPVDGIAAAIIEPIAAQHPAGGRTEPRLTLFAPDAASAHQFGFEAVADLAGNEALLDTKAAQDLAAVPGDTITVLAGDRFAELRVAGVGDYRGTTSDEGSVVVSLHAAQVLLARLSQANHVLVSNSGDETAGVGATGTVEPALGAAVAQLGLDVQPVKRDGLDFADATGNAFVQLFTTFGSFSMAAGILLIFLIFVMLATERRPEMGMARAVGTQRRHLVQTFLYEGAAYDLAAAAVGAVVGIGVSWVMVRAVASAFAEDEFDLAYSLSGRSLLIAYAMGVLLTLLVVAASAWRVSRLNIVSAIRDIPELEEAGHRRWRVVAIIGGVVLGALMAVGGAAGKAYLPWMLGVSIAVMALVPIVRLTGGNERLAYTLGGGFLVVWWMLPLGTFDALFGEMSKDFSIWIASGLVVVVAATWLITYNADILLRAAARLAGPFPSLRPVAKMAVAYPLKSRFRTGVTMAMFMLVVFTLVTGSTIPSAFIDSFDDVEQFGGGYDVRAVTAPAAAVADLRGELPAGVAGEIVATGAQSFLPVEARQADAGRGFERYPLRGVDDAFLDRTTYRLAATARGYTSTREVWEALRDEPGLAVVDPFVVPRRDQWGSAILPDFQLSGFYLEDAQFDPVRVVARDPYTGASLEVTVIGVLTDNAPFEMAGITVSQRVLEPFGSRALPTVHNFAVRDGADPTTVAGEIETALLSRGVEVETYADLLDEAVGGSRMFVRLVQGFMALGLVVGVAALGVVTARAVVERRQQIGMLRAIGFQPEMIRRTLLAETSVVAFSAIAAGTILGLVLSYNVIADAQGQPGNAGLAFAVPWVNLGVIFAAVVVAALLTTLAASLAATRTYPAEALRYQ
jgi:putative ABC transport system permease protein